MHFQSTVRSSSPLSSTPLISSPLGSAPLSSTPKILPIRGEPAPRSSNFKRGKSPLSSVLSPVYEGGYRALPVQVKSADSEGEVIDDRTYDEVIGVMPTGILDTLPPEAKSSVILSDGTTLDPVVALFQRGKRLYKGGTLPHSYAFFNGANYRVIRPPTNPEYNDPTVHPKGDAMVAAIQREAHERLYSNHCEYGTPIGPTRDMTGSEHWSPLYAAWKDWDSAIALNWRGEADLTEVARRSSMYEWHILDLRTAIDPWDSSRRIFYANPWMLSEIIYEVSQQTD